jgi:hypothetical protein
MIDINSSGISVEGEGTEKRLRECMSFLESVEDFDERTRLLGTLESSLDTIRRLAPDGSGKLYYDFAPLSFFFEAGSWREG